MWELTKDFRFESAHRLIKGYSGKCNNLHGHSWNGRITVECEQLDVFDMGVDFKDLGRFCKELEAYFDHNTILHQDDPMAQTITQHQDARVVLLTDNPTCETLARYAYRWAKEYFSGTSIEVKGVTIEETCTTSCTYKEI